MGWVVSVTPRPRFAPGKGPPVPTGQEAGWAPEPVWTERSEEKSFAPAGNRTPIARSSSRQSDTILTELPRLLQFTCHYSESLVHYLLRQRTRHKPWWTTPVVYSVAVTGYLRPYLHSRCIWAAMSHVMLTWWKCYFHTSWLTLTVAATDMCSICWHHFVLLWVLNTSLTVPLWSRNTSPIIYIHTHTARRSWVG
jgi:hypothetical protein